MAEMTQSLTKIGNALKKNEKRITAKLGGMIKWEYFCSAFLTSIEKNPALAECTEVSLVKAILDASQLRLIPDGVLGEAYIVPYGKTATLIPGYKGLIQLCLRSNLVKKIGARIVYQNDLFKYEYGMNEACIHIPTEEEPGEIRGAYGTFEMSDGVKGFEFWPYKKLMNHKIKFSKGLDKKDRNGKFTSPWRTNEEAMIVKTVLRSITKILPKSIEDISIVNAIEDGIDLDLADVVDIEIAKEKLDESKKKLDAEKPNLDALKDEKSSAIPPAMDEMVGDPPTLGIADENATPPPMDDDIPMDGDPPPEDDERVLIDEEQNATFQAKFRELKITTAQIVKYLKKNGFADTSQITKEKFDLMMLGLEQIGK